MNKKNSTKFSLIRGASALGIALLVAFLLIFFSAQGATFSEKIASDRKSTRLNSSHTDSSRMPSSA